MEFRIHVATICFLLCLPPYSWGQVIPAYSAKEIKGQVVDAQTGRPVAGAVIVARWNWYVFYQSLEDHGYAIGKDPLNLVEAVTDSDGNYVIPAWGPKMRVKGQLSDHDDPRLLIFKSGYIPLEVRNDQNNYDDWERDTYLRMSRQPVKHNSANMRSSQWDGKQIRLKKFSGTPKEYAAQIADFQNNGVDSKAGYNEGGGLWWRVPDDHWKAMPQMLLALHREKIRLGEDGQAIQGVYTLFGRSGQGHIVDAKSGQPVSGIINITWTMRDAAGTRTRRFVEQRGWSEQFVVSPWLPSAPHPDGWEIVYDQPPLVRVYTPGYRSLPDTPWQETGMALRLQKWPATSDAKEAILRQLREWRHDLNTEIAANPVLADAVKSQQKLLELLQSECDKLTPDVRTGICYEGDSKVALQLQRLQGANPPMLTYETPDGPTHIKIMIAPMNGNSALSAAKPAMMAPTAPVGGFSIEPAKPQAGH